jgi:sec-independent protein translocase protein TatA
MLSFNSSTLIAFFSPGPMELLIIGGIAVLLFGSRLPEVARNFGKSFVEFKKGMGGITDEVRNVQYDVEQAAETAYYTPEEDDAPSTFEPPPEESANAKEATADEATKA